MILNDNWHCENCALDIEGTEAFKKHLEEVHNIDRKKFKGKREVLAHLDAAKSFVWIYNWTINNEIKAQQSVESSRR